jgi:hypothetical protein
MDELKIEDGHCNPPGEGKQSPTAPSMRLWTVTYSVMTTWLLSLMVGVTLGFSSPAVLQLEGLADTELRFNMRLSDIFAVSRVI